MEKLLYLEDLLIVMSIWINDEQYVLLFIWNDHFRR